LYAFYAASCEAASIPYIASTPGGTARLVLFTESSEPLVVLPTFGAGLVMFFDDSDNSGLAAQHKLHNKLKASSVASHFIAAAGEACTPKLSGTLSGGSYTAGKTPSTGQLTKRTYEKHTYMVGILLTTTLYSWQSPHHHLTRQINESDFLLPTARVLMLLVS
jgi:hypothetical protein